MDDVAEVDREHPILLLMTSLNMEQMIHCWTLQPHSESRAVDSDGHFVTRTEHSVIPLANSVQVISQDGSRWELMGRDDLEPRSSHIAITPYAIGRWVCIGGAVDGRLDTGCCDTDEYELTRRLLQYLDLPVQTRIRDDQFHIPTGSIGRSMCTQPNQGNLPCSNSTGYKVAALHIGPASFFLRSDRASILNENRV